MIFPGIFGIFASPERGHNPDKNPLDGVGDRVAELKKNIAQNKNSLDGDRVVELEKKITQTKERINELINRNKDDLTATECMGIDHEINELKDQLLRFSNLLEKLPKGK